MDYQEFLRSKRATVPAAGLDVPAGAVNPQLFPFQRDLSRWALRKGRAALFADTGLGKTAMQLEWARHVAAHAGRPVLIVAPLAVAQQTAREGAKFGVPVQLCRQQVDVGPGVNITNYEMIAHFTPDAFAGVVLDESSILKSLDGKTRAKLTALFADTPYRLCCTATPAPNDISEIANHAEFLGILSRVEMLAMFFVHDDAGWRLKGHAAQPFYRWLASWAMSIRRPSDLGYPNDGYDLPALRITPEWVASDYRPADQLFFTGLHGIGDRVKVRQATLEARVAATAALINGNADTWIVWCGLNEESAALTRAIPGAVEVQGSDPPERKEAALLDFAAGQIRVIVTKAKIAGYGLNWQHCHRMAFVGLSDSWEAYYQCIRRCYRFGQTAPVDVRIVLSEAEDAIYQNILRKEEEAQRMAESLVQHVQQFEQAEIAGAGPETWTYETADVVTDDYRLLLGDSAERLQELATNSIDLSVYSPPFASLYTYSPTERDLGNCRTPEEFTTHYGFIIRELLRVHKPGRLTCVHVAEVPAMLSRDGYIGLKDFPGAVIRAYTGEEVYELIQAKQAMIRMGLDTAVIDEAITRAQNQNGGWIYHGRITLDKDPQAQAIRTKSKALLFVQLHKDAAWSRPALADTILLFRKPGENAVPITPDINNDEWIEWARPIWYGIKESDTLQYQAAREDADERHICPLQLGTIERCIRLWSNPGETVLSPFGGIGSEPHEAIRLGRKAIAIELKRAYFAVMCRNVARAWAERQRPTLFDLLPAEARVPA